MVDELPDEREPREQNRAGVQMVAVRHRLVLDHGLGQVRQQLVARRKRRQLLEHRPEPTLGQPVLARQEHAPKLGAVQAAGFGGMRDGWQLAADHCAGRHGGRPGEELAARKVTVVPARPSSAIVRIHNPLSPVIKRAFAALLNGDISTRYEACPSVEHGSGGEFDC